MSQTIVTSADIAAAVRTAGVVAGDTLLVHSSMKSMGYVDGGPAAVISGLESVLGKEGTLVFPTLSQKDFKNSYRTWYMDKPSDVGLLTEYFRKQMYVYRSNQATHSVAARGVNAYELTFEHTAHGPHICPFGSYAFSDSSPWAKLEALDGKVLLLGVNMRSNTLKHMVEGRYVEALLNGIPDPLKRAALQDEVARFDRRGLPNQIWPFFESITMQDDLDADGLIRHSKCGDAELLSFDVRAFTAASYDKLSADPGRYVNEQTFDWIRRCKEAATD